MMTSNMWELKIERRFPANIAVALDLDIDISARHIESNVNVVLQILELNREPSSEEWNHLINTAATMPPNSPFLIEKIEVFAIFEGTPTLIRSWERQLMPG